MLLYSLYTQREKETLSLRIYLKLISNSCNKNMNMIYFENTLKCININIGEIFFRIFAKAKAKQLILNKDYDLVGKRFIMK